MADISHKSINWAAVVAVEEAFENSKLLNVKQAMLEQLKYFPQFKSWEELLAAVLKNRTWEPSGNTGRVYQGVLENTRHPKHIISLLVHEIEGKQYIDRHSLSCGPQTLILGSSNKAA
jgi:hypothetical protein